MADDYAKYKVDVTALSSQVLSTLKEADRELGNLEKITLSLDNEVMALLGKDNEILVIYQNMMNEMKTIHQKALDVTRRLHILSNHYKAVGLHLNKLRSGTVTDATTAYLMAHTALNIVEGELTATETEVADITAELEKYRNNSVNAELKPGEKKQILKLALATTEAAIKRSRATNVAIKKVHVQANVLMNQLQAARNFPKL